MVQKIGDKSCQSNFGKQLSDFGFLSYLITTVINFTGFLSNYLSIQ